MYHYREANKLRQKNDEPLDSLTGRKGNRELNKKMIALSTAITLGLGSMFTIQHADAESIKEMQEKTKRIEEQQSGVKTDINRADQHINKLQNQQETVEQQIHRLELAINDSTQKIAEKSIQIEETKEEIEALKAEIIVLKERIAKRNELLKERAVSLQESGGNVSYLEVLLGSSSFSDFIGRVGAVTTIVEADQEILKQHEIDKKDLEDKQKSVETKLNNLESMRAELENMKSQLTAQKGQKDKLMAQLEEKEDDAHELKMNLKEEEENLAAQASAMKEAINLEKNRLAELEAARKKAAAEEKKRAAEAAAAAAKQSAASAKSSSGSSSSNTPAVTSAPPVSSGQFTRPSAGRVTSQIGSRWNKFHAGIDIAQSGTVPVVAAADGVVIRSYLSSSYGNCIMVSHSIGGQTYTTVYAHLSSRNVGSGQVVAKGQQIGIMGNTGHSFGQHLHFELHKGAWNVSKTNAVNPLNYVSM